MYRSYPGKHEDPSSEVNPSMGQAVHESRATMKSLSESSQVNSSWAFMDMKRHPLDCQLRSQIQGQMKSEPPFKGGASDDKEEAMKARERLPNMPSPTTNQIKGGARP